MPTRNPSSAPQAPKSKPGEAASKRSAGTPAALERAVEELRHSPGAFPNVSARWLAGAALVAVLGAAAIGWLTLCLLYWQGSWQLLYHPAAAVTRTPASLHIAYEPVRFAVTEAGDPRLSGWWIPADGARFTVLFLHGADGNLSNTVNLIGALHRQHLSVFAIDYRGYGQSQPGHPSEPSLRQDAGWALTWLVETRHAQAKTIVVFGSGVGATLAAELVADHPELAGVVLEEPKQEPLAPVFLDPRSRLVPARWLVQDRYDLNAAAAALRRPSLWLFGSAEKGPPAYRAVGVQKSAVWLRSPVVEDPNFGEALRRWLDEV